MKKLCIAVLALCALAYALPAFDISIPNEIPAYEDLKAELILEQGDSVSEARLYVTSDAAAEPSYTGFAEADGVWTTLVPYEYLKGEELLYFVQVQTSQGNFVRTPGKGFYTARLLKDETPPSATLKAPERPYLKRDKEQLVVFDIRDQSDIVDFEVVYGDTIITKAAVYKGRLAFLITPTSDRKVKDAAVVVTLVDRYNNKSRETFSFSLEKAKEPFFAAEGSYDASLEAEYSLGMGKSANTTDLGVFFSDLTHDVTIDYALGGETRLKAGPVQLELEASLGDSISVFDVLDAYPNTLIADYQNILNLWHPWNFANEFDYAGETPRLFYNSNEFLARLSIADPWLAYAFGDQKIDFQDLTVKDLEFRGTSVSLGIPILNVKIGKGLTDLGLYQTAWPQNFFGLQAGLNIFDYWWMQTNISFISSLQGRYDQIAATGVSPIGTLYDLGSVKPEQNLVFGLGTGTDNKLFALSAGLGLTLYNDDASKLLDADKLASDINDGFGFDISPYLGYVDTVNSIFPVFDYFPLTEGLAVKALNRELWGISYGADLAIPSIGLDAWFHKTDSSYRSLAATVDTDLMDIGGSWEMPLGPFDLAVGYDWTRDNIPDILFTDLLPLFLPDLASTAEPTADDISTQAHSASLSISTPVSGIFANLSFSYAFEYVYTNAAALAELVTADADKAALLASASNDTTMTHTAGLQLKSGRIKLGDLVLTAGAKTEDSYVTYVMVDGTQDGSSAWEFDYSLDTSLQLDRYKLALTFRHQFSTAVASDADFGYKAKFTISKGFFDRVAFDTSFGQTFNSGALDEYAIGGGAVLEKKFGPLSTAASLGVDFTDSLSDNSKDSLKASFTLSGGISL